MGRHCGGGSKPQIFENHQTSLHHYLTLSTRVSVAILRYRDSYNTKIHGFNDK
jgi:hypothetical protein